MKRVLLLVLLLVVCIAPAAAQRAPMLPDSSGWGIKVLTSVIAPGGARWVGTYGRGIFVLDRGARVWRQIHSDTTSTSLSWDFVNSIAFGPRGQVWYGTVGNGWGLSTDGGRTWRNWTLRQLGPEWQYVVPDGITVRGDTTVIATADGLLSTADDGTHWIAIVDSTGPAAKGPADSAIVLLGDEYTQRLISSNGTWIAGSPHRVTTLSVHDGRWVVVEATPIGLPATSARPAWPGKDISCGYARGDRTCPRMKGPASSASRPKAPLTTWFDRPIAPTENNQIDQTYRYGSTMGGNFQQHQGVEFNNGDGTPVHAIDGGLIVYAGRAEAGALTVSILHDSLVVRGPDTLRIFSVYYHNSALDVKVGDHVARGQQISRVGNTGRATNDHLHLEVHAAPDTTVKAVVDSLNRYPAYTTNPELWIAPLPGTGIVAGLVRTRAGAPVKQARVYGLAKDEPRETPYAFAETYGDRAHSHPLYQEDFAVSDVMPGEYTVAVEIEGQTVRQKVRVEAGKVSWVELRER